MHSVDHCSIKKTVYIQSAGYISNQIKVVYFNKKPLISEKMLKQNG
ncbi:hypothetical protein [Niallia sp.]|nr:hypothetical protein [Niallia sp.]